MDALLENDSVRDEQVDTPQGNDTTPETATEPADANQAGSEKKDAAMLHETHEEYKEIEQVELPEDNHVPEELVDDEAEGDELLHPEEEVKPQLDYSNFDKPELVKALETLLNEKPIESIKADVDIIKVLFYKQHKAEIEKLHKQHIEAGNDEESFVPVEDAYEQQLKDLLKRYKDQRAEFTRRSEAEKVENLKEKQAIIEEIKALASGNESLNETFQQFRELQKKWRAIGPVPQKNMNDLWESYNHHVEKFYDFIKINKELRDLDLKKNFELKIELCEKAEELLLEPSVVKAFRLLQEYHEKWRDTGPVHHEMRTEVWNRFKDITAKINKRHQEYFESLKEQQTKNLEAKTLLCDKAEELLQAELKTMADWEARSKELIELQNVWRSIGFAPKKDNTRIYQRFRTACDTLFKKKREFFSKIREDQNNNMQMKIDLCMQAEALKDSTEWKKSTEDLIQIQKKWKEVGPVPRKHSDAIWKRFRAACDTFFNNKSSHFANIDSEYEGNLKLKLTLIEEVENYKAAETVEENFKNLKEIQRRWTEIGFVPLKQKEEVNTRFRNAINHLFDTLKVDESKRRMLKFKNKIEQMPQTRQNEFKMNKERDKLINKLKKLENDIMLLDNNIGFFAKSKNADAMVHDFKVKIEQAKEEMKVLEEKIRLIDKMTPE